MAYFNHAFQKLLLGTKSTQVGPVPGDAPNGWWIGGDGSSTLAIPSGTIAPVAAITTTAYTANQTIDGATAPATLADCPQIYLAQGSINTKDKLGPFAGGYQETVKTKGINPRYVTKFWKQCPFDMQQNIVSVCLCPGAKPVCGTSYYLRIDIKGSPALRFLTHNIYKTFSSNNVCCPTDPEACVNIDPMQVQTSWAWGIARDPIMSQYILPILSWNTPGGAAGITTFNVAAWLAANPTLMDTDLYAAIQAVAGPQYQYIDNGFSSANEAYTWSLAAAPNPNCDVDPTSSTVPCLNLVGAYIDTQFGTCSFHPQDFYELQPIQIYQSITDQQGDPCVDTIWCFDTIATPQQGSGYGHRYIRDLILFRRYMQEHYVYDPRLREVMDQDVIANSNISPTGKYVEYNILHSVPRFNNPTGVFDNDQYLITIIFPCGTTDTSDFEQWMGDYIELGGNGVTLQTITGTASGPLCCLPPIV